MMPTLQDKIYGAGLHAYLKRLQAREFDSIRYGDPSVPYMDGLCIRWIGTGSGNQFAIKDINRLGQEGSGEYFQPDQIDRMKGQILIRLTRYETPNPALQRLRANLKPEQSALFSRERLRFYPAWDTDSRPRHLEPIFPGEIIIELKGVPLRD